MTLWEKAQDYHGDLLPGETSDQLSSPRSVFLQDNKNNSLGHKSGSVPKFLSVLLWTVYIVIVPWLFLICFLPMFKEQVYKLTYDEVKIAVRHTRLYQVTYD